LPANSEYCRRRIDRGDYMAYTIPESIRSSATAGERILFRTLKQYLPDDYIVYFEPEIVGRRPDFVIIGPDIGVVVLEVKDYTKNTLFQLNHDEWTIVTSSGEQKTVKSPLKQAQEYMFKIKDKLEKDKELVQLDGQYKYRLKFPCGAGAVFTRLSQREFIEHDLYSIIEPNLCLTRDEIDPDKESFCEQNLHEKVMNMFIVPFRLREPLSINEMERIRFHLFPEVRISAEFREPVPYQDQILLSLHDIKTMDLLQESLAKQLGDKHRLIRGVAGSGKTLILACRAKLLAKENPDWRILILCYNISLARTIEQMVEHMMQEPDDLFDLGLEKRSHHIEVRNFHAFLQNDLRMREEQIPNLLDRLNRNEAILPTYDAIMIDEGQDFESEWFQLVTHLLNPATQSLLLVEDRAQSIYKRKRSYIQDTGLSFQGRSKVLSINYRNTKQIVEFAWAFYQRFSILQNKVVSKETEGEIIAPQSTRRKGFEPAIVQTQNFPHEARLVAEQIQKLHKQSGVPYSEMVILYRVKRFNRVDYVSILQRALSDLNIPNYWVTESASTKRAFNRLEESVKISTIDSSKGLDFQAVFIVNVDNMPYALEEDKEREASLLYIGMTRAKQYLWLSYSGQSDYTVYLEEQHTKLQQTAVRKEGS